MGLINKIEKIKAELKRLKNDWASLDDELTDTMVAEYDYLLDFLSTLESETTYDTQKYSPRPSVGIEDVARVQFASHAKVFDKKRKAVFDWEQFKEVAGIFYGFGKKDTSNILESEKPVPKDLEEAAGLWYEKCSFPKSTWWDEGEEMKLTDSRETFIAGAKWQKEQMMKEWLKDRDGCFWDGVNEGKKAKEDAILAIIESRISEIIGDAQPRPALRAELQELIAKIRNQ